MPICRLKRAAMFWAFLLGAWLACPGRTEASRSALLPDYMRLQYAGQAGLFSIGPGYSWWHRRVESGLSYGYVPAFIGDRNIQILSQRNSLSLARFHVQGMVLEPAMVGMATHVSVGDKYQVLLPKSQQDYYWPDGLFFWFFSGAKVGYMFRKPTPIAGMAAQIEVGTINQYFKAYTTNQSVTLDDILSLAISTQFYL
ncbi:MAG: hypothetical protein JWO30_1543 [Fibrobacteres bacterium]|nr:hypothetical protein [Fibrobacterota bacterium]